MDQHTSRPRKSESMPSITAHGFHWRLQGISKKLTRFLPCPLIQYSCSVKVFGLLFDSCVLKCMSMSNVTEIPMCFNVVSTVSSVHLSTAQASRAVDRWQQGSMAELCLASMQKIVAKIFGLTFGVRRGLCIQGADHHAVGGRCPRGPHFRKWHVPAFINTN